MKIDASRRGILTGRWRKASNGIRPPWSGDESHFLTHCTRSTPVLMLVKTTFCNAARAAIRALISKITSAASVTPARRLAPNRYFLRATPEPGICSSPLGTRAWRISQLNAAAVRIAVSQWQLSFARRSPGSTSRNLIANFATDVEHVQPAVRYQP